MNPEAVPPPEGSPGRRPSRWLRTVRSANSNAAVGLEMGLCVALGAGFGLWLDSKLGTGRIFGLLGLLAGIGAAAKALWRVARQARLEAEQQERQQTSGSDGPDEAAQPRPPGDGPPGPSGRSGLPGGTP